MVKQIREQAKALLKADENAIPGWTLEPGNTRRIIKDPQELFNRFVAAGGKLEQFMQCIAITKEKLEGQYRIVTGTKGKGLASAMGKLLEGLTEEKVNEPSLGRKK